MPTGPSPLTNGSFASSSAANMISGRQNARVFPDPVNAIPIISLPENLPSIKIIRPFENKVRDHLRNR